VRNQNLFVDVDHPGWMQLLLLKKQVILAKLRRQYSQLPIRDIKIRVVPSGSLQGAEPSAHPSRRPEQAPPDPGEVEQALSEVRDADLKEKLRRLLLRSLQRQHD
jgi:hypothetical protein